MRIRRLIGYIPRMDMAIRPLTDPSRLQEIYDLRVLAWEHSENRDVINRTLYPHGLSDALDTNLATTHFIIEEPSRIVACARVSMLENIADITYHESLKKYFTPEKLPFGYYSRLAIHPDYRGKRLSYAFDKIALDFFQENAVDKVVGYVTDLARLGVLERAGFKVIGIDTTLRKKPVHFVLYQL